MKNNTLLVLLVLFLIFLPACGGATPVATATKVVLPTNIPPTTTPMATPTVEVSPTPTEVLSFEQVMAKNGLLLSPTKELCQCPYYYLPDKSLVVYLLANGNVDIQISTINNKETNKGILLEILNNLYPSDKLVDRIMTIFTVGSSVLPNIKGDDYSVHIATYDDLPNYNFSNIT